MICASCNTALPEGHPYRFCPFCGTSVAVAPVAATEAYPAAPEPRPTPVRDTEEDVPAVPASAATAEAATRFDLPAVKIPTDGLSGPMSEDDVPAIRTISAANPELPKPRKPVYDQDAKTVLSLPAVTAADLAKLLHQDEAPAPEVVAPAPKPAPATVAAKPAAEPDKPKGKKGFSETAWFMAAVTPDQLEDVEAHNPAEAELITDKYATTERLPDPVRKQFSLAAGEAPPDDADKGDKGNKKLKKKK